FLDARRKEPQFEIAAVDEAMFRKALPEWLVVLTVRERVAGDPCAEAHPCDPMHGRRGLRESRERNPRKGPENEPSTMRLHATLPSKIRSVAIFLPRYAC